MGHKKSKLTTKVVNTTELKQTSTLLKDAPPLRRRPDMEIIRNVRLIWFDPNIDCYDHITQLGRVMNILNTFTDIDQCLDFITELSDEKVSMIISCETSLTLLPLIYDIPQLHTIFIFCQNKIEHQHQNSFKTCSKIQGIFTDSSRMCRVLQLTAQQNEQNSISMSFIPTTADLSNIKLDQLEPSFMYSQIMKEILLTIEFEEKHFEEFLDYCRESVGNNASQLQNLDRLKRRYQEETPIWWYTYETLLYPMVNRSLRTLDADLIIRLGFFIKDLHFQLQQLHNEQFSRSNTNNILTVYRGQGMGEQEFKKMMETKGGLLSFNCFLSTSKNRDVSSIFAESAATDPNLLGILFIMTVDPSQSTTPFAAIQDVSYYGDEEEEVLFSMHTVFRIKHITSMDENQRLFQVDLTLTSDNDPDLHVLTDRIREETFPEQHGWGRLGEVLLKMGRSKKAEEIYNIVLEQALTTTERATIYHQLGRAKRTQGQYQEAVVCYEKSIEIEEKRIPRKPHNLANSYNNVASVYQTMGDYSKALAYHEKALEILKKTLPSNHSDLAPIYNNIGLVYKNIGQYSKALSSHQKALKIRQQSLPPTHPNIALSYMNIGNLYYMVDEYSKALSAHEKALKIRQQSLPSNHPDVASSYVNIGAVYYSMNEHSKALSYYEKALAIQQESLSSTHLDLASSYSNIGSVYEDTGNYSKAHSFFQQAFEIAQQSLPVNHPVLKLHENNFNRIMNKL